ncbi:MAG: hypothetical protein MUF06_18565 [Pirellulaceae bacterium]|nr:hypothetical protein [Pirellulaceae bacterium]
MTFITNLTRSRVAPKTAQLLASHWDINLTMNTYTMLGVLDQASAVEAQPPLQSLPQHNDAKALLRSASQKRA